MRKTDFPGLILLVFFLAMLLLMSDEHTILAATYVGGPITSDTTWTRPGSPYVVTVPIEVAAGATLTIEPGVTVRFDPGTGLQVRGGLVAPGTVRRPVTFTSNQAVPAPGDWGNIAFTDTAIPTIMDADGDYVSGSLLQHCVVEYAGAEAESAIHGYSLLVDRCLVRHNQAREIYDEGAPGAPARIAHSVVSNNQAYQLYGAGIYADHAVVYSNTIQSNAIWGGIGAGGGIYVTDSTVRMNQISDNTTSGLYGGDGGGIYAIDSTIGDNVVTNNVGSGFYNCGGGIYALGSTVTRNLVSANRASGLKVGNCGGIYASGCTLRGNWVIGNIVASWVYPAEGGGVCADSSVVEDSIIIGNSATSDEEAYDGSLGGGIRARGSAVISNTLIFSNSVSGGACRGAGVYLATSSDFRHNTVVANHGPSGSAVGGLDIEGTPQIQQNILYGNEPYDVVIHSSSQVSGSHNYWGTVSGEAILARIYDGRDDPARGVFLFLPFLEEPDPNAPLPPPQGLTAVFQEDRVNLTWEVHPLFATAWGYLVHYDREAPLPFFAGTGLPEGGSPIDVGAQISTTLTGLDPHQDVYVAVAIYDDRGRESWYSSIVWRSGRPYLTYLPLIRR